MEITSEQIEELYIQVHEIEKLENPTHDDIQRKKQLQQIIAGLLHEVS